MAEPSPPRKSFVFFASFLTSIDALPHEYRYEMFAAVAGYALYGKAPEFSNPLLMPTFLAMKPNIDTSNQRYDKCVENGKKGGAPAGNQNARKQPRNNQETTKDNQETRENNLNKDMDTDKEKDWDEAAATDTETDKDGDARRGRRVFRTNNVPETPVIATETPSTGDPARMAGELLWRMGEPSTPQNLHDIGAWIERLGLDAVRQAINNAKNKGMNLGYVIGTLKNLEAQQGQAPKAGRASSFPPPAIPPADDLPGYDDVGWGGSPLSPDSVPWGTYDD